MDDLNLLFFQANDLGGKKSNQAEVSKKIRQAPWESGWSWGIKPEFYPGNLGLTPARVYHKKIPRKKGAMKIN